jgi:hypothetical protein
MPEKVLVYLGGTIPLAKAREFLPDAIYRPPAKQGDIVSDVCSLNPTHILLIEGSFRENLSVWHKEIVYALQYPTVKAIYGAASIGALRAAELDWIGMIGIGQIYQWYRDGATEDDSEVAVSYAALSNGDYRVTTVPLVDIRAGVEHYGREFANQPVAIEARKFLERMRKVNYMDRTQEVCEQDWAGQFGVAFPLVPQKAIDAMQALTDFRQYQPDPKQRPSPDNLSRFFQALYERDRRININGTEIPQQHIDAYVLLHNPEHERICWDSANQQLALMLCDELIVTVSPDEVGRESIRYQQRSGIETDADFSAYLSANGWTRHEYDRLMIQNARIRKLQHAYTVAKMYRRNSQQILDYLRTHQAFDYWAAEAVQAEKRIAESGVDDWLAIDLEHGAFEQLADHFEKEGLELKSNTEEYLLETGFSNLAELAVALTRIKAGKEELL